ncbi:MAG: hypothetical protein OIF57_04310 [Marinobacterium sp.]|nr:hypothetical protein [Marinobacterium sp.]
MNSLNVVHPVEPEHRIREISANCWWVYQLDQVADEFKDTLSRVVFIGSSRQEVRNWVQRQREEQYSFVLSGS